MVWLKRVCIAALLGVALLGFLLSVDNATPVALRLLHLETTPVPMFWWLYAAFACGVLVGLAFCLAGYLRGRLVERRLRRVIREHEQQLARVENRQQSASTPAPVDAAVSPED